MKKILLPLILLVLGADAFAMQDSVVIPLGRQRFHDRINEEQVLTDKADGKLDGIIKVGVNDEINLQVTDALTRRINEFQNYVETNNKVISNNEKVAQLRYIEELIRSFRIEWKLKTYNPALAPLLVDDFEKMWKANMDSLSILPYINEMPFETGNILIEVFNKSADNYNKSADYLGAKKLLFLPTSHTRTLSVV